MRLFFLLLTFLIIGAPYVSAQDQLFKEEEKSSVEKLEDALDLTPKEDQQVKGTKADLINEYYRRCLTQKEELLNAVQQKELCTCTAGTMNEEMSLQNIQSLYQNTRVGQLQRDRLYAFVYAPCTKTTIEDIIYDQCISDPNILKQINRSRKVCRCLSQKMAEIGANTIADHIIRGRGKRINIAEFLNSRAFDVNNEKYTERCIWTEEYGW